METFDQVLKKLSSFEVSDQVLKKLNSFKARYNKYARSLIDYNNHVPVFLSISDVYDLPSACSCWDPNHLSIIPFPFNSPTFAGKLLVSCNHCNSAYVHGVNSADLMEYYSGKYAATVQPFRLFEGKFYHDDNPVI